MYIWLILVGGQATPLKNMKVNWDSISGLHHVSIPARTHILYIYMYKYVKIYYHMMTHMVYEYLLQMLLQKKQWKRHAYMNESNDGFVKSLFSNMHVLLM